MPPSKVWRSNFCSSMCRVNHKLEISKAREKLCLLCCLPFTPRLFQLKTGNVKYCSIKCRTEAVLPVLLHPKIKQKSQFTYIKNLADGKIQHPVGFNHPRWKGGQQVCVKRRIASGKANQSLKIYRSKNPEKVKEWSSSRANKKTGRLPNGTVKSLLFAQNYQCVYCKLDITNKYHVDHIYPLSKGGEHKANNIQILCPPCNLKKSAKLNFKFEYV